MSGYDTGSMFGPTFWLQKFTMFPIQRINCQKNCSPTNLYLPTWEKVALPYTSPNMAQNLLSDWLWAHILYVYNINI
jgi:hypothetical protein